MTKEEIFLARLSNEIPEFKFQDDLYSILLELNYVEECTITVGFLFFKKIQKKVRCVKPFKIQMFHANETLLGLLPSDEFTDTTEGYEMSTLIYWNSFYIVKGKDGW